MIQTSHATDSVVERLISAPSAALPNVVLSTPTFSARDSRVGDVVVPILTASVALHLIITAFVGGGVPPIPVKASRPALQEEVPAIIEEVQVEPEVISQHQPETLDQPALESAQSAEPLPAPEVPDAAAIPAVPSTVPVAFGLEIKGPVKLVSDPSRASGSATGRRRPTEPISIDAVGARNLLIPEIAYPVLAKRNRQTGTVVVEFRTSPTGDIQDVRVRESSRHALLDRAAVENLRRGRWTGTAGFYVKAYEFTLQ